MILFVKSMILAYNCSDRESNIVVDNLLAE